MNVRATATEAAPRVRRHTIIWLTATVLSAAVLRIALTYVAVFGQEFVGFVETDAWYHMRLVDAAVRHFPHRIWFDPYLVFPGGEPVNAGPMLDWLIAAVALLLGGGAPSERLVDLVGAYTPVVVGALTSVPVYVLGRELFSPRAGRWAAFIVAVVPGQFLTRSLLGFTDHHCLETLLSTCTFMCVVLAMHPARVHTERRLSVLAGLCLAAYCLTWSGGTLVVAILLVWGVAHVLFVRTQDARGIRGVLVTTFLVAGLILAPWWRTRPYFAYDLVALGSGVIILLALRTLLPASASWRSRGAVVGAVAVVAAAAGFGAFALNPASFDGLRSELARISPFRSAGFVAEAAPLLHSYAWRPFPLWNEYASVLILLVPAALLFPWWRRVHAPGSELPIAARSRTTWLLLGIWTSVMLAATVSQIRFSYYLAVNVALFAGLGSDLLLERLERGRHGAALTVARSTGVGLILALTVMPATLRYIREGHRSNTVTQGWFDALLWMRVNTPEPFEGRDTYLDPPSLPDAPSGSRERDGYGVLSSWEYGSWITRIARRVPSANPRQTHAIEADSYLIAEDPAAAARILERLHARFVIVDKMLQAFVPRPEAEGGDLKGGFGSMARSTGRSPVRYCEELRGTAPDRPVRTYCYPPYYRTMVVRLYGFEGRAVTPRSVTAIRVGSPEADDPRRSRVLTELTFPGFEAAGQFVRSRPHEDWRIASSDPLTSCVPLEPLVGYERVFRALGRQPRLNGGLGPPAVQVFEFTGADRAQ